MFSQDILMAFIGGAGLYIAPAVFLRSIAVSEAGRGVALLYGIIAIFTVMACLVLVFSSFIAAVVGFAVAAGARHILARETAPDFVVEGTLLKDSVSPKLAAELAVLEEAARDGHLADVHAPVLRDDADRL